jgi:methionine aminotransferase
MRIKSKLPNVGTTIFTVMSKMAAECGAINLSQGYPNFDTPEGLKERVSFYLNHKKNQYAPMAGLMELREVLAAKVGNLYGREVSPTEEITIVAGATQGLFTAITTFVDEGDEVILIEPAYDSYRPSVEFVKGVPVIYELDPPQYQVDWDELGRLVTERTRMIIINTPQNPIGKAFKKRDMERLEQLTHGTDILVLSDEVYEHLIYDGLRHESVLRYDDLFRRCIAVYSFGKTFHSTGWKMGYCVGPSDLMAEFRKVHQFNVFCVNSFIQYALADFMRDAEPYLSLPEFYQRKRDLFDGSLRNSRLQPLHSEGTYFQLFDYSDISDQPDTEFVKYLTRDIGVAAIPVSVFYSSGRQDGVIRLCFAKTDDLLHKAGGILSGI